MSQSSLRNPAFALNYAWQKKKPENVDRLCEDLFGDWEWLSGSGESAEGKEGFVLSIRPGIRDRGKVLLIFTSAECPKSCLTANILCLYNRNNNK
jgi:hypothetical protein